MNWGILHNYTPGLICYVRPVGGLIILYVRAVGGPESTSNVILRCGPLTLTPAAFPETFMLKLFMLYFRLCARDLNASPAPEGSP